MTYYADPFVTLHQGDVREVLRSLPADSVQTCVTSPPYWSLRDYGIPPSVWGGAEGCEHEWGAETFRQVSPISDKTGLHNDGRAVQVTEKYRETLDAMTPPASQGSTCALCGAWRGALGLEPTPDLFVAHIVEVFREVRRVLRPDGTLFLNIGDSYASQGGQRAYGSSDGSTGRGPQPLRVGVPRGDAYGRRDTGRSGSPDRDCACRSLCDGCRAAYQLGRAHSVGLPAPTLTPSPSAPSLGHTASGSARLPTSDSALPASQPAGATPDHSQTPTREGVQPRASLASNSAESDRQPRESNLLAGSPDAECLSCGRSLPHSAQGSARMEGCNCDSGQHESGGRSQDMDASGLAYPHYTRASLKPKDLVGIPWMVAFALRADGWYLRQDIIWAKPNPMPESVRDRCTKAHEYLFLLSKGQRYYWDATAIAESSVIGAGAVRNITPGIKGQASMRNDDDRFGVVNDGTRNKRSVWSIPTAPFPEAHFATFPPDLVRPCVLAGAPEGGTVLDPFVGSGTTAMVAKQLGRKAAGIDLNPEYLAMAVGRMTAVTLPFSFAQPPCEIVAEPGAVVTGQCK